MPDINGNPFPWEAGGFDPGVPTFNNNTPNIGGAGAPQNPAISPAPPPPPLAPDPLEGDIEAMLRNIAENGILGQEGIDRIRTNLISSRQGATNRLAQGLGRQASRRLGTRAGAVTQVAANAAGQAILGEQEITANLEKTNILSRFQGVSGLFDLARLNESRRQFDTGLEEQKRQANESGGFSFLDIFETGVRAYAAFQTGGASEAAVRV